MFSCHPSGATHAQVSQANPEPVEKGGTSVVTNQDLTYNLLPLPSELKVGTIFLCALLAIYS